MVLDEIIQELENKIEIKNFIKKAIREIDSIIECAEFFNAGDSNIETDYLEDAKNSLEGDLDEINRKIKELENCDEYENQLENQKAEYRKMQGF